MSSRENEAETSPATLNSAQRQRAEAGFTPAQARHSSAGRLVTRLNAPRAALVETEFDGAPRTVNRQRVTVVREEWRVVDRWWTDEPVDRRYFEVVLESGQNVCVYRDQEAQSWFSQKA
jgi:hypothetical protein